mmetsp:Transcript_77443/g.250712  ORF Transcript_77443/g.250712 Transcript_77443/m.250712 type:complete len:677 (+) Transcript_77443:78-2108(+)
MACRAADSLQFTLENHGKRHLVKISLGEVKYVGRGSRCVVVTSDLSASSQHVELSVAQVLGTAQLVLRARDRGTNGTGVVDCVAGGCAEGSLRDLSKDIPEELHDGSALVIPLRRQGQQGTVVDAEHLFVVRLAMETAGQLPATKCTRALPLSSTVAPRAPSANGAGHSEPEEKIARAFAATGLPDVYDAKAKSGRWRYLGKLGEGGLALVYKAVDCTGPLGEVAIKVLKHHERANWGKQYAFAMHREAQWSLQRLHNERDPRYRPEAARLFARYLQDHTGYAELGPADFNAKRHKYEVSGFDWEKDGPAMLSQPYVVMELVKGECLNVLMDREKRPRSKAGAEELVLSPAEKREVLTQAAQALEYMFTFGLIHRDFRGCNMHLAERLPARPKLKVLDLGVMISAEDGQMWSTNQVVQAFQKRGETEEKKRRYDWLPWEIRAGADGQGPAVNFAPPVYSFDMFSFGILIFHLLLGRAEAREALETLRLGGKMPNTKELGIDPELVKRMFQYESSKRPRPDEVIQAFQGGDADAPRDRSRSRGRGGGSSRTYGVDPGVLSIPDDDSDQEAAFGSYRGIHNGPRSSPTAMATQVPNQTKELPAASAQDVPVGSNELSNDDEIVVRIFQGRLVHDTMEQDLCRIRGAVLGRVQDGAGQLCEDIRLPEERSLCWEIEFDL